jgi:hypothetical protein
VTTKTTFHLSISRPALAVAHVRAYLAQRDPLALLFLALALLIAVALLRPHAAPASVAVQPTPEPIIMIATARAELLPAPALARASAPLPTAVPHMVWAYVSPNGAQFPDPIPAPDPRTWIARYGDEWIEVMWSPGPVWIRSADIGANLADIAPVPPVRYAPVGPPQPAADQPSYQVDSAPAPQPTLTNDERQQALIREFGPSDITGGDALAAHQAREDAYAAGRAAQPAAVPPPLTSEDLPCNCP